MFISVLPDIINEQEIATVDELLSRADFVSGHISGGTMDTKRNLELPAQDKAYIEALRIVESAVRESDVFNYTAYPRAMTRPIFSRYEKGMFYDEHVDFPLMNFAPKGQTHRALAPIGANYVRSDLSMTLFLSDPETYDGGELSFSSVEPLKFKLQKGSAVLYPTGVGHSVLPVTRGVRTAAIFWVQTLFPVEAQRKVVNDAYKLHLALKTSMPDTLEQKASELLFFNLFRMNAAV